MDDSSIGYPCYTLDLISIQHHIHFSSEVFKVSLIIKKWEKNLNILSPTNEKMMSDDRLMS